MCGARIQECVPPFSAFSSTLAISWIKTEATGTQSSTNMGCQNISKWLNLLHHTTISTSHSICFFSPFEGKQKQKQNSAQTLFFFQNHIGIFENYTYVIIKKYIVHYMMITDICLTYAKVGIFKFQISVTRIKEK